MLCITHSTDLTHAWQCLGMHSTERSVRRITCLHATTGTRAHACILPLAGCSTRTHRPHSQGTMPLREDAASADFHVSSHGSQGWTVCPQARCHASRRVAFLDAIVLLAWTTAQPVAGTSSPLIAPPTWQSRFEGCCNHTGRPWHLSQPLGWASIPEHRISCPLPLLPSPFVPAADLLLPLPPLPRPPLRRPSLPLLHLPPPLPLPLPLKTGGLSSCCLSASCAPWRG